MRTQIVVGALPEAIRMAPLVNGLRNTSHIETKVCVTAQHRQMSDSMLDFFRVQPDYDLDVTAPNQTLLGMASKALSGARAGFVLVSGDTSTMLRATIVSESTRPFDNAAAYTAIAHAGNPYGDGTASHAFEIFW